MTQVQHFISQVSTVQWERRARIRCHYLSRKQEIFLWKLYSETSRKYWFRLWFHRDWSQISGVSRDLKWSCLALRWITQIKDVFFMLYRFKWRIPFCVPRTSRLTSLLLLKAAFRIALCSTPLYTLEGDKMANRQILHASATLLWLQRDLVKSGGTWASICLGWILHIWIYL